MPKFLSINVEKNESIKRSFTTMVYIFTICSMLGWLVEVCFVFLSHGKIVNRGIIYGPFCIIYGFGALILYWLFYNVKPTKFNIPYTFVTSAAVMGAFELVSGLFFKYVLDIEMWNYDGKFLEILNYTTVPIIIAWGVLGTIYVFFLHPLLIRIISKMPKKISKRIAIYLVLFFVVNYIFSVFKIYFNPELLLKMVNPSY